MDKKSAFLRLTQAVEFLKDKGKARNHEEISALTGITRSNITSALNGDAKRITEGNLRKFANAYSDYINADWLISGLGEMAVPDKSLRPFVEAKAAAGFMDGVSVGEVGVMTDLRSLFPAFDFMITAEGDSMEPDIESGDTLVCRRVLDRQNPPIGEICVFDTKEGYVVKILKSFDDESVTLHSINPRYPDYSVLLSDILGIAQVVAIFRSLI